MVWTPLWNPGDQPVQADATGRTIPGRSWGAADTADEAVSAALADGRLIASESEPPSGSPYRESWERAGEVAQRGEALSAASKDQLAKSAESEGLPEGLLKDELVRELAHRDTALPRSRGSKATSSDEQEA